MDERYLGIPACFADDPRLSPFKKGGASKQQQETAKAYHSTGETFTSIAAVCPLKREPDEQAASDSELLYGETFIVYDKGHDWLFGQAPRDHYVGWVPEGAVMRSSFVATHEIVSLGSYLYRDADLKSQPLMKLPMAAQLTVTDSVTNRGSNYLKTDKGWLFAKHAEPLSNKAPDFVKVGESLQGLPYLWAGRSSFGLDCSGFVQLIMQRAGFAVLRDADMQEATIGEPVAFDATLSTLQRGDLVFWPGHVGVMRDSENLLHANGHTMTVTSEALQDAVRRIAYLYGAPRAVRRPRALSGTMS